MRVRGVLLPLGPPRSEGGGGGGGHWEFKDRDETKYRNEEPELCDVA